MNIRFFLMSIATMSVIYLTGFIIYKFYEFKERRRLEKSEDNLKEKFPLSYILMRETFNFYVKSEKSIGKKGKPFSEKFGYMTINSVDTRFEGYCFSYNKLLGSETFLVYYPYLDSIHMSDDYHSVLRYLNCNYGDLCKIIDKELSQFLLLEENKRYAEIEKDFKQYV